MTPGPLPLGAPLPGFRPPPVPTRRALEGATCRLEPLDVARHADGLAASLSPVLSTPDGIGPWTYLPYGPFADAAGFRAQLGRFAADPALDLRVVIAGDPARPLGHLAFMRIEAPQGVLEIGHVLFGPGLARERAATEAVYLLLREAFDLGYRRVEWKCNALNEASRRAALRYGFQFEGIFRQAVVSKGRNRDTAWYAMLDGDWPRARRAFEAWLAPANFDAAGRQRRSLAALRDDR